jgi:molecular chaperone HscC
MIERNTIVPASRAHHFQTLVDNQKLVRFGIYQGEARDVSENVNLGLVEVPVPPRPAGEVSVEVRFSYDASGLLEVDVHVPATDLKRQWVISEGEDGDSPQAFAARREALAALKVHPRDEAVNAATLARAERCYENFLGDHRQYIGELIAAFQLVLERQDPRETAELRTRIDAALDALEGERFL